MRGLTVERQRQIPIIYKEKSLSTPLRLDLLVAEKVIVECKASTQFNDVFKTQVLTYLRLTDLRLGIVINFGEKKIIDGFHRVVNRL